MLELNKLYNMDCMEGMKQFPDKYFEIAIVDPPYGIGESGGKNKNRGKLAKPKDYKDYGGMDKEPPPEEYFTELFRVSKNQIIFGANHYISRMPFDSSCWIVWDKVNGETDFADCELAWTSFKTAVRQFRFMWNGMMQGKSISEGYLMQGDKSKNEFRIHPNQKPVKLYEWILKNYAKPGDKILDTHAGSASSLIACHNYGFEYIGFEIDSDYFQKALSRIESVKAQLTVFDYIGGKDEKSICSASV